nr:asialoglycoprotein receptor 1 [Pogona vitticeps]XP_020655496.1 asialoglycoprotein receptor 1 [Pogona vitticeps]
MSQDYQDLTSLDVEGEGGRPILKAPTRLPPKPSWKPHLCPSRRLVLVGLGFCGIFSIVLLAFGVKGSNYSSQLWGLEETLRNINETVARQMGVLQAKETNVEGKITKIEGTVKQLTEEGETVKTRLQSQVNDVQRNLRSMNCDLQRFKYNRTAGQETCCPKDWSAFRKSCYWESRVGKTWEEAKEDCKSRDAHLVIINSYEEQLFVAVRVKPEFTWIGLTDASGSWKWVDGTSYTVRQEEWCREQPDDWYGHGLGGGEDCAHLHRNGCWNDDHCSRLYGWVCEMETEL